MASRYVREHGPGVLAPALAGWFASHFGLPTSIQCRAWPAVAAGRHLLISAPTGTGKTLAAFLPLLAALQDSSPWNIGAGVRGLYVAPLRALGNDVHRNLGCFLDQWAGLLPPGATVPTLGLRTGDTPLAERLAFAENPPDVLLTTPESLAVLLSQPRLTPHFSGLRLGGHRRGARPGG